MPTCKLELKYFCVHITTTSRAKTWQVKDPPPPHLVASAAVRFKAVVLLLLFHPLFVGVVLSPRFAIYCVVSRFAIVSHLMSRGCYRYLLLPHGVDGWFTVFVAFPGHTRLLLILVLD